MPDIDSGKKKIIRDPVHGDIEISEELCNLFIDTAQFQRLRNIEQTNLHVLFPSATHTRFEHSIGVFHIGKRILDSIISKQTKSTIVEGLKKYRNTVLLACLLHDIGHAPFSHLGEDFYPIKEIREAFENKLGIKLPVKKPSPHEIMSCLVAKEAFKKQLKHYNVDFDFFCRLITRTEYKAGEGGDDRILKNTLINILNGSFDADKIDYLMRDTQSAGVSLVIDVNRMVRSFNIVEDGDSYEYVIEKSGFSVANTIIANRNYMFFWIYGHHKVQYHYELMRRFLAKLKKEYKNQFKKLFSLKAITGSVKTTIPHAKVVRNIDDNDIKRLIKYLPEANASYSYFRAQIYERNHFKPIWKTQDAFDDYIKEYSLASQREEIILDSYENPEERISIEKNIIKCAAGDLKENDFMIFKKNFKYSYPISSTEAKFYLNNKLYDYTRVFKNTGINPSTAEEDTIFLFVNNDNPENKEKLLKYIKKHYLS